MYDSGNGATSGQVLDFVHHWEAGILLRVGFIFPVAELTKRKAETKKSKQCNQTLRRRLLGDVFNVYSENVTYWSRSKSSLNSPNTVNLESA